MESCDTPKSKATFDPGWNDPPNIAYNAQKTTPNRPRNFLNKRVAFPLSGGSSPSFPSSPANIPPLPATIHPPPSYVPVPSEENAFHIDSKVILQEVKDILTNILDNSGLGSKGESIKKKIIVMEEMWSNGKINVKVQVQMKDLAYALRDDQPSRADDIHKALMVDHVSDVSAWMPGVKQLIYFCLARSELIAIDKEE